MECLEIPVDHRLVRFMARLRPPSLNEQSSHLEILETHGRAARRNGESIPYAESHHTLELAAPDTKGGVLVALLRPPRNQTYEKGYTADMLSCRTTKAFEELVSIASGSTLSADDVSAFDTLPFSPEGSKEDELINQAERTFGDMVRAKKPDVVLCCYQGDSRDEFVRKLRSIGVGKVFDRPRIRISAGYTVTKVNAFHPSYAVNYHSTYSCFRRLLLLEFVKAFSLWCGEWEEEDWMGDLRSHCKEVASRLVGEQKLDQNEALRKRWITILDDIERSLFKVDYFNSDANDDHVRRLLIDSNLTWHCADASLFLSKIQDSSEDLRMDVAESLLNRLEAWCKLAFELSEVPKNEEGQNLRAYFDPQCLTMKGSHSERYIRELRIVLCSLLRDVNISFPRDKVDIGPTQDDTAAWRLAFHRISKRLESSLRRSLPLSDQFQNLWLN